MAGGDGSASVGSANYYYKINGLRNRIDSSGKVYMEAVHEVYYADGANNKYLGEAHPNIVNNQLVNLHGTKNYAFAIRDKLYTDLLAVAISNDGNKILIEDYTDDYWHSEYYIMDVNTEEKKYIDNDVKPIYFAGNNLLYLNENKKELKLNDKVIGIDHSGTWVRYNSDLDIIAFCCNNTLSVYKDDETKMIAGNVKNFEFTTKDNISYLTNNNELYIYYYGDEPQKLCDCEYLIEYEVIK